MASLRRNPESLWLLRGGLLALGVATVGHGVGLWDLRHAIESLPDLCLIHALTGHDCPGCGMGRALVLLARGQIGGSLHQHPFGLPLLVWAAGWALLPEWLLAPLSRSWLVRRNVVPVTAIGLLLGWWLATKVA